MLTKKSTKVACDGSIPDEIGAFLKDQEDWMTAMIEFEASHDLKEGEFWRTISIFRQQFNGLIKGSEIAAKEVSSGKRDHKIFVRATEKEIEAGVDHTVPVNVWGLTIINWLGRFEHT
jgi:hypothetical protein